MASDDPGHLTAHRPQNVGRDRDTSVCMFGLYPKRQSQEEEPCSTDSHPPMPHPGTETFSPGTDMLAGVPQAREQKLKETGGLFGEEIPLPRPEPSLGRSTASPASRGRTVDVNKARPAHLSPREPGLLSAPCKAECDFACGSSAARWRCK